VTGREDVVSQFKEDMIKLIQSLPDDCTLDDLYYHLYVREKVQRGIAAIDAGQVVSREEFERRLAPWRKSSGTNSP
jgi:hypothetical protein